ncbi:MAG: hypothetical protein JST41_03620 [Bacteroidetes bacterium]|nr:hypothetical protein [Bacteroidota bacterium]MCC6655985.1 hypothetical protein [Flavobacteriales bacterium]HMU14055.1 hypothetical protein [Flavobacteriales bacterium]
MKDQNGFDELARQKLAERDFTFDPSHWTAMEGLLARPGRKRGAWWPWLAAGVLLVGGATIWITAREHDPAASVTNPGGGPRAIAGEVKGVNGSAAITEMENASYGNDHPGTMNADPAVPVTGETRATAGTMRGETSGEPRMRTEATRTRKEHGTGTSDRGTVTMQVNKIPVSSISVRQGEDPHAANVRTGEATNDVSSTMTGPGAAAVAGDGASDERSNLATGAVDPVRSDASAAPAGGGTHGEEQPDSVLQHQPPSAGTGPVVVAGSGDSASTGATAAPAPVDPVAAALVPPAWLAITAPYELTLLGGAFSTTGRYTGVDAESWPARTERQWTTDFGLEAVRNFGRHFAVGTGVHFSSYKERLITDEVSRTEQQLSTSYFWVAHDTMVTIVVGDTAINGATYHMTQLVPMTINELGVDTDTAYQTMVIRQRRSALNTVSYVELPLLLDAHTARGRWVFGLRGGPSVGLLTGRSGSLPDNSGEGYHTLNEVAFRELTVGWTARAYVRYRLSAGWSVGVEPTMRGQLFNSLRNADLDRRASAMGMMLSLSYRIQPTPQP